MCAAKQAQSYIIHTDIGVAQHSLKDEGEGKEKEARTHVVRAFELEGRQIEDANQPIYVLQLTRLLYQACFFAVARNANPE